MVVTAALSRRSGRCAPARATKGSTGWRCWPPGWPRSRSAVIGGRLLHEVARRWARRTRHSTDVAGFLASRQIGRRAGGTRALVIATVTMALAAFAASTWGLVERQRDGQAAMEIGAARVYRVDAPSPARLLTTVRDLDPGGRQLAAAVLQPRDLAGGPGAGGRLPTAGRRLGVAAAVEQHRHRPDGAGAAVPHGAQPVADRGTG